MYNLIESMNYTLFKLSPASALGKTVNFFIADTIKLFLLLGIMIYVLSFIRTFIPIKHLREYLGRKNKFMTAFFAALFGALTPFCTCSSIPIFISFLRLRLPFVAVFAFLITSPLVNQYVVAIMPGMIGIKVTLIYIFLGIGMGIVGALVMDKMNLEDNFEIDFSQKATEFIPEVEGFSERNKFALHEIWDVTSKIWRWLLVGVALGAIIHNFIPRESIQHISDLTKPFDVLLVTVIAVPMYGSCVAVIPIAIALFKKGIALGTAFAFMMAFSGLSFPEAILLRRVMNLKLIGIFFGIVFVSILLIGYILNFIEPFIL